MTFFTKTAIFLFLLSGVSAVAQDNAALKSAAYTLRDLQVMDAVRDFARRNAPADSTQKEDFEFIPTPTGIRHRVEMLCSPFTAGRKTGTPGAVEAARVIAGSMRESGIRPLLSQGWFQGVMQNDGSMGHNVIGILNGAFVPTINEKYIIVAAHYDGLGEIDGNTYPGADSNASGVAMMLEMADRLSELRKMSMTFGGNNYIFVALDAKSPSYAGAEALLKSIQEGQLRDPRDRHVIRESQIKAFVNLDIIGSTEEPVRENQKNFLIMLSGKEKETPSAWKSALLQADNQAGTGMDLSFDYYGSKDFTELFYRRVGDQRIFLEAGFKCVVFTSGITMKTNKLSDTPESLDYDVLENRTRLVFTWLQQLQQL